MASSDNDQFEEELRKATRKKRPVWYRQPFNEEWLKVETLKRWLKADAGDRYSAMCTVCCTKLTGVNRSALMKHAESEKHVKNCETKKSALSINTFFQKPIAPTIDRLVAKAEISLTAFMVEHNVPFRHMDHLVEVLKSSFPDSQIAQKVTLKRTKASYTLQDGLAHMQRLNIIEMCKSHKFSVLIDESTDISVSQILAVVVRFFDERVSQVLDVLLDLIEVENGTAAGLYQSFKDLFISNDIPLENIIGFGCDNCATMMGHNNGFQVLLKADVPHVFVLGCICHSMALCANHASQSLPSWLEAFVKDICFYFARSSKCNNAFNMIQDVVEVKKHRMLKLCKTRWLSRGEVVKRIIEQWDALELFFMSEAQTDKVDCAGRIYEKMRTPGTKHMLLFLSYVLQKVDALNVEFQSQQFRLHKVFSAISDEYRSLLGMFIRADVLASFALSDIDPLDTSVYKAMTDIELGGRCKCMLTKQPLDNKEVIFRKDALSFLSELCSQICKRFPFSKSSVLAQLKLLDPCEALGTRVAIDRSYVRASIIPLASHFPNLVPDHMLDTLQDQWRALHFAKDSLSHVANCNPPNFWKEIGDVKDGNNEQKFGFLSDFMCALLALPHSTASVERVFSQVNIIKTKQSNKLKCRTVADRISAKQGIAQQKAECFSWNPHNSLVNDVMEGRCHSRYIERQKNLQTSKPVNFVDGLSDSETDFE